MKGSKIKLERLMANFIKITKCKLLIYYTFLLIITTYSSYTFTEVLNIYRDKNSNKLVIRYNAQDNFSIQEIHRRLVENAAPHRNLHLNVYVWDCQRKVDKEYFLDFLYRRSKKKDVKQCESRINSIEYSLRRMIRLSQRHRQWKHRLDRLNNRINTHREQLIQDRTTYMHLKQMQEVIDIKNLENSIPAWRNLSKETKDFLVRLKVGFSAQQEDRLQMDKVINNIEFQIKNIHNSSDLESEVGQQAITFFQNVISSLKKIESRKDQTKIEFEDKLSSFFKNYEITSLEEQEKFVQDLVVFIEEYTETTEVNHFINTWEKTVLSSLSQEAKDITLLNMSEKDRLTQALQQLLTSVRHLRKLTSLLDLQFLEFTGLFIPKIIFPEGGKDIFDLSEEQKHQFIEISRQAVHSGHIPIYISEWFKDYYVSYNYERVNTFLDYAESVQKYLQTMKEQINSQYKKRSIQTFINEITQSVSSVNGVPSVQNLINSMLEELHIIASLHQRVERDLLESINKVSDLFSNLSDAVDNKYYGSPFYVLIEYIKSRNEEAAKKSYTLHEQIVDTDNEITEASKEIVAIHTRISKEWQ